MKVFVVSLLSCLVASLPAQVPQGALAGFSLTRADAGPARTELGYNIVVNKYSSLHRQAVTAHDTRVAAQIVGDAIVKTVYGDREYNYKTNFRLQAAQDLAAVEVRFILFDVFGERMTVLSSTDVRDIPAGTPVELDGTWRTWENDVTEYLASLAFVARVRTKAGQVINADLTPVLAEANKFARKLTVADLEPKAEGRP